MSDASADLDLAAIRERADAATPGPWEVYDPNEGLPHPLWCVANDAFHNPTGDDDDEWVAVNVVVETGLRCDAEFIAAARADIPALLAEVERLQGELSTVWALADRRGEEIQRLRARIHEAVNRTQRRYAVAQAERDRLANLMAEAQRRHAEAMAEQGLPDWSHINVLGRAAMAAVLAERDEARAATKAERDLRVEADDLLLSAIAEAEGLKRDRDAVVEAAKAWRAAQSHMFTDVDWSGAVHNALIGAVDALPVPAEAP